MTYQYLFRLISNPQPGGPYLISHDNLTKPITLTMNQQNYTLSILSDTPFVLASSSNPSSERWEPNLNQYQTAAIVLAIVAIIVYLINSRRLERQHRQI